MVCPLPTIVFGDFYAQPTVTGGSVGGRSNRSYAEGACKQLNALFVRYPNSIAGVDTGRHATSPSEKMRMTLLAACISVLFVGLMLLLRDKGCTFAKDA